MEKILIVDDNRNMQFILKNLLSEEGFKITSAENGKESLEVFKSDKPDLVLLDIRLPGMDGIEVLKSIREIDSDCPVIMITAYGDVKSAVEAIKLGAYDYVTKPFDNDELLINIKKAIENQNLAREVKILREKLQKKEEYEKEMGESPEIKKVLKQVDLIAPTNMSVIIQGKSGTGKEVIANLIHHRSPRKDKPFVAVDCGSIPETLIESELFGHEKGAFTGANNRKSGVFEMANNGTLFLDEIANLPVEQQVKLLRVIQERKLKRLGSTRAINVDVRILVATNIDLLESVKQGKFREDLYHRICEFKISLPLLQERKEDIPLLANLFLRQANKDLGKKIRSINRDAMDSLLEYEWPGNVRELKHVIKRGVLLESSTQLSEKVLQLESPSFSDRSRENRLENNLKKIMKEGYSLYDITKKLNEETEREIILNILKKVKFNKSKAAQILGIDRNTLYAKIKNFSIE